MAEFRIVAPPCFRQIIDREHPENDRTAPVLAAEWLAEQCAGGFVPMHVAASGAGGRMILSGPDGSSHIVFRREGTGE